MDKVITVKGTDYKIIKLLGKGKGGYSYLAENNGAFYTLKKIEASLL